MGGGVRGERERASERCGGASGQGRGRAVASWLTPGKRGPTPGKRGPTTGKRGPEPGPGPEFGLGGRRTSMWNLAKSGRKLILVQSSLEGLIWGSPRVSMLSRKVCSNRLPEAESAVSTTNSREKMLANLAPAPATAPSVVG